jgi:putative transposase
MLIDKDHPNVSVRRQCDLLDMCRSGLYYQQKPISEEDQVLMNLVDKIYTDYPFFGARRMSAYLKREEGIHVGRKKVSTIYETLGLEAVYPKPKLSVPNKEHKIYPYLLRDAEITEVDQVWSTDITYIRLKKGFVYLAAIIDWYSRYVLDWEISVTLEADFCIEVLTRCLMQGKCDIFNTDQGVQFTSTSFTSLLLEKGINISMDGKGRALDNIFVERLWRSVKYECVYLRAFETVKEAVQQIRDYFLFYNNKRPHQALSYKTPTEVYYGNKNG